MTAALAFPFWLPTSPDFFWHARTGELILENLAPPTRDVFSYTHEGERWLDHEWLAQPFIYTAYSLLGYSGAVFLIALMGAASVFVCNRLMLRLGVPDHLALLFSGLTTGLAFTFWQVRPAQFTFILLSVFLYSCYLYRRGKLGRLWHLPPLMVLWANLHAGYVLGLALLALLLLSELVEARGSLRGPRVRHVALVSGLSVLGTALNPYGLSLLAYPVTYFIGENYSLQIVSEWQSPQLFHGPESLLLGATIALLALLGTGGRRLDVWRAGLGVLFLVLALQSARHQAVFALAVPPILGELVVERWPWLGRLERRPVPLRLSLLNGGLAVAVAAGAILGVASYGFQTGSEPRLDSRRLPYPAAGADYVARYYADVNLFNEYAWGGYIIQTHWPRLQVFIDGRADLHGSLLREYLTVWRVRPEWREVLDRYEVGVVLMPRGSALASTLREAGDWREVFQGPFESVFVRSALLHTR